MFGLGMIRDVADLYTIEPSDLMFLPRMGAKSAENLITGIKASLNVPFERVLFALGIRFVGVTVAKRLAYAFHNIDALMSASFEELTAVEEIGERIAQSLLDYFSNEANKMLVERLKVIGLKFELDAEKLHDRTDKLKGKSIVISGVFNKHSRDEYKAMIEKNGGKNVGSVSKATSFILAGENMGPAKLEKAQKLNIPLMSENDFLAMLDE